MDNQKLIGFAERRYSEILKDGFKLFGKTWTKLVVPLGLFYLVYLFLSIFLLADLTYEYFYSTEVVNLILNRIIDDPNSITQSDLDMIMQNMLLGIGYSLLDYIIGAIITALAMSLVSNYVLKKLWGYETSLSYEMKRSFNGKLILVLLLLGVGIPVGFTMLFIPGIIIFGYYIFSVYTNQMSSVEKPIKEARLLSKKFFWKTIGIFVIDVLIILAINFIYQIIIDLVFLVDSTTYLSWYNPSSRNYGSIIIYELVYSVIPILLSPLFICLLTSEFSSSLAKNQLNRSSPQNLTQQRVIPQGSTRLQESRLEDYDEQSSIKQGLYCPYCGTYMDTNYKFCPTCGESLNLHLQ